MITCFTSAGYIRFARSLIRFCCMGRNDAISLTNSCAYANMQAFYATPPSERKGETESISLDLWSASTPYRTEIQLYRAMQILAANMKGGCYTEALREAQSHLNALTNDVRDRFRNSFNIDIEDSRTVYAVCESTLNPVMEPEVCLLTDWRRLENWGGVA